ncbi:MAG: pilus assembly protein PilM [Planctomycetota bacterium]
MSPRVVGLNVGGKTTRVVEARLRKGAFEIRKAGTVPTADLANGLREMGLKGATVLVGVTGRDMILRTTQVPPVPAWQLRDLMGYEIADIAEQSGDALSADFNILTGARGHADDEMVLLALVRDSLIEERDAQLSGAGVRIGAFTPNAIALHNAVVATDGGEGTVMVAALGGRNTDIALIEDGELLFARNLGGGGGLFTDALAETFRIDAKKAEAAKRKLGVFPAPGQKLAGQQATVARVLEGPLRQVVGMLQSSLALCRNQLKATDLALDRVLLCGPGAAIPGMDQALTRALGVPVARFDPTDGYVTGEADIEEDHGPDYAVATGLALMGVLKDAYRIEVLPEAARKRKTFLTRTLWLLLAGAILGGHLVTACVSAKGNFERASADLIKLRREVEARKADQRTYERTLQEVRELSARLSLLEDHAAPGHAVLVALDLLDAWLPPELWLRGLRTQRAIEAELGHGGERRPFVTAEGSGKEQSRGLTDAVTELTTRLRAEPAVQAVVPRFTTDSRGAFSFTLSLDASIVPPAADGDEEPEPEDADGAGESR